MANSMPGRQEKSRIRKEKKSTNRVKGGGGTGYRLTREGSRDQGCGVGKLPSSLRGGRVSKKKRCSLILQTSRTNL